MADVRSLDRRVARGSHADENIVFVLVAGNGETRRESFHYMYHGPF